MQNLIQFFTRYGSTVLFIGFEILCFYIIVKFNNSQREIFVNSANVFSGFVYKQYSNVAQYYDLSRVNDSLNAENARLHNIINNSTGNDSIKTDSLINKPVTADFSYISAKIINNSTNLRDNNITLDKGRVHGVNKGMGVITDNGVIGIVRRVSDRFSVASSILNSQTKISASILRNHYFGSLIWKGEDTREMILYDIPKHADVIVGDTVITSGYSSVFPEGIFIGKVSKVDVEEGSNFYTIKVKIKENLSNLHYVFVINNFHKIERDSLETPPK